MWCDQFDFREAQRSLDWQLPSNYTVRQLPPRTTTPLLARRQVSQHTTQQVHTPKSVRYVSDEVQDTMRWATETLVGAPDGASL